jgi:hypothetical protein
MYPMEHELKVADRILNCMPSRNVERDWNLQHAIKARLLAPVTKIPAALDLRESWWSIGDQMDSGSCVGWGTADSVCRWHFVKAKTLPREQRLSARYVWMAAKETDAFTSYPSTFIELEGTSLKAALDIARKFGLVTDAVLPFGVVDSAGATILEKLYRDGTSQTFFALAAQLKIASYFNLGTNLDNWKIWIATNGPVLIALGVDATWDNATATKGYLDIYRPRTMRGGHCAALVGYTHDRLIIRNSWGTAWGDKGFAYVSTAYAKAAIKEAYGVAV